MQALRGAVGHDVITSSGDTLLGADDKAGVAEIVTAVAHLAAHPELPRPTIRVAFTPDEEVGQGGHRVSLEQFGADCAYTLDGSDIGGLQDETFSADEATLTVTGVDIHPGHGDRQDGQCAADRGRDRRGAALRPAHARDDLRPRGVPAPVRDHRLRRAGAASSSSCATSTRRGCARTPSCCAEPPRRWRRASPARGSRSTIREQYRNMREALDRVPDVVAAGEAAIRAEGLEPVKEADPRRHRRVDPHRARAAHPEPVHRRPRVPLACANGPRCRRCRLRRR